MACNTGAAAARRVPGRPAANAPAAPQLDPRKRAEQIASEIEAEILADRWRSGDRLGNEAQLASANEVSRWTMREAIALLEQAGSVVRRRGAQGGLFVATPALELVRNSLGTYLELASTPYEAIAETRLALTREASRLAAANMTEADRIALARLALRAEDGGIAAIEAMSQARIRLRDLSGNRVTALFLAALADVGMHSCWLSSLDDARFSELIDALTAATRRHTLAMVAGELGMALEAERRALEITSELHRASAVSGRFPSAPNAFERAYAIYPSAHSAKKAERVAWAIRRQIGDRQLQPGDNLGSEESLMREHGVGRPVLREAIRMLERSGAAEMRRGGFSGLTVTSPNPERVVALARDFMRRREVTPHDLRATAKVLDAVGAGNPVAKMMLTIVTD